MNVSKLLVFDLGTDSKVTTDGSGIAGTIVVSLTGSIHCTNSWHPVTQVKYYDTSNNEIKNNNNLSDLFKVGNTIDGLGFFTSNFNGGATQQITHVVTSAVNALSTLGGNIGTQLIGDGVSLGNSGGVSGFLDSLNGLFTKATNVFGNTNLSTTTASTNKTGGVGSIVATLVSMLNTIGVDTEPFSEAYQASMIQMNGKIDEMNQYGKNLMAGNGVNESNLLPAKITTDSKGNTVITMTTLQQVSRLLMLSGLVNSYISGWTSGIGDALDTVFTGNLTT